MEEKLSNLGNENHILRRKTLSVTPRSNRSGFVKPFLDKFTCALVLQSADQKSYESPTPSKYIASISEGFSDTRRAKSGTEKYQEGGVNDVLPYWLSNASALLCLLQRNLRSNGFLTASSQRSAASTGPNGRLVQGPRSSFKYHAMDDGLSHMEAKYPALL